MEAIHSTANAALPLKQAAVGVKVKKQFLSEEEEPKCLTWFQGTVTQYLGRNKTYLVVYDDGDKEEMTWAGLKQHMLPQHPAAAAGGKEQQAAHHQSKQGPKQQQAAPSNGSPPDTQASRQDQIRPAGRQQSRTAADQQGSVPAAAAAAAATALAVAETGQQQGDAAKVAYLSSSITAGAASATAAAGSAGAAAAPAAGAARKYLARKSCGGAGVRMVAAGAAAAAGQTNGITKRQASEQQGQQQQQQDAGAGSSAAAARKKPRSSAAAKDSSSAGGSSQGKKRSQSAAGDGASAGAAGAAAAGADEQPKKKRQHKRKSDAGAAVAAAAGREGASADTSKAGTSKADTSKAGTSKAGTSKAGTSTAGTSKAGTSKAGTSTAGTSTAVPAEKKLTKDQVAQQLAYETFAPARILEDARRQAGVTFLTQLTPEGVARAEPAVMAPDGSTPLWEVDGERAKVVKLADAAHHLVQTAKDFPRGTEPWRKFFGLKWPGSAGAAAAAAGAGKSSKKSSSSAAGAAGAASITAEAAADAVAANKVLFVKEEPYSDDDVGLAIAIKTARDEYWKEFRLAAETESRRVADTKAERAAAAAAAGDEEAPQEHEKATSQRPDRVAESKILKTHRAVNYRPAWGYVPGCKINQTHNLRSEMSVLGLHKSPMTGIVAADLPTPVEVGDQVYRKVRVATSICLSGCYEDDKDADSGIVKYTGEGGNDLLGKKKQVADQKLVRGNKALLGNIALGLPVRVLRRNDDTASDTNSVFFYDGLYDVVSWVKTRGSEGYVVYMYGLKRRPGQEPALSKPIPHFKGVRSAKRGVSVTLRDNIVCKDLSKGLEVQPLVVVNQVDRMLPPGLKPTDKGDLIDDKAGSNVGPLIFSDEPLEYLVGNVYDDAGVSHPKPPKVVEEGSAEAEAAMAAAAAEDKAAAAAEAAAAVASGADGAAAEEDAAEGDEGGGSSRLRPQAAATSSSSSCGKRGCRTCWYTKDIVIKKPGESPHELLKRMNYGHLPYGGLKESEQAKGWLPTSGGCCPVLKECGDWTGCTDPNCNQRQVERGLQYRLEVFKTPDRGWAVCSWDPIRPGSLVCVMLGKIIRAENVGEHGPYSDSAYFFDMTPRSWSTINEDIKHTGDEEMVAPKFILCAKKQGGVARFINHSCDPNLYVQPICVGHTDTDMVAIGLFADKHIAPFTELTYHYGESYIQGNLGGVCLCGQDCCRFKPRQAALQQ